MIKKSVLYNFIRHFATCEVGRNRFTGKATTLIDEVGEIYRLVGIAETREVSCYGNRTRMVETSIDDPDRKSRKWTEAGKKVLFLNAICKKMEGQYFVTEHLSTESVSDMMDVAMAFVDALDEIAEECRQ